MFFTLSFSNVHCCIALKLSFQPKKFRTNLSWIVFVLQYFLSKTWKIWKILFGLLHTILCFSSLDIVRNKSCKSTNLHPFSIFPSPSFLSCKNWMSNQYTLDTIYVNLTIVKRNFRWSLYIRIGVKDNRWKTRILRSLVVARWNRCPIFMCYCRFISFLIEHC